MYLSPLTCHIVPVRPKCLSSTLFSNTLSQFFSLNVSDQVSHPLQHNRQKCSCVFFNLYIFGYPGEDVRFCTDLHHEQLTSNVVKLSVSARKTIGEYCR